MNRGVLAASEPVNLFRVGPRLCAAAMLVVLAGWHRPAQVSAAERSTAVVSQPVHPVLLGQADSVLATLEIMVPKGDACQLHSVTLSLEGTTDLADFESLGLFFTGDQTAFANDRPWAERISPAAQVSVAINQPLSEGRNRLWIAGQVRTSASLDHRVAATAIKLQTSMGPVAPSQPVHPGTHRLGVAVRRAGQDGVHTSRIPVLATTPRGTLLCSFDIRRRSSRDLQGDIDVGLCRSTDAGQTWEPMQVILDQGTYGGLPEEQNGVGDAGLLVDRLTGEIFCFALWVHGRPGTHQWQGDGSEPGFEIGKTAQFLLVRSTDDGRTWSAPQNLTRQIKAEDWSLLAPSPQQGIQLADGTLLMPVQGRSGDATFATIMTSPDHGATWKVAPGVYLGGNECQAAELADGTLMLNIRNGPQKRRAVVTTRDRGRSWQNHPTHAAALIEPTCNGSLYRWPGRGTPDSPDLLLFANPQSTKLRTHHTVQVSLDDGATWPERLRHLLDEGRGFGYPSLSRVDDDRLGIVYEGSQAHLVFERLSRQELLTAED